MRVHALILYRNNLWAFYVASLGVHWIYKYDTLVHVIAA
jgi:hypothetical protein